MLLLVKIEMALTAAAGTVTHLSFFIATAYDYRQATLILCIIFAGAFVTNVVGAVLTSCFVARKHGTVLQKARARTREASITRSAELSFTSGSTTLKSTYLRRQQVCVWLSLCGPAADAAHCTAAAATVSLRQ